MFMRRTLVLMITLTAAATLLAGDDATNPHGLMTLAAKQAWITLQRDLEKLDAQYQRDRQARINKALVELETAKAKAAQAANADEIVRIGKAVDDLQLGIASSTNAPSHLRKALEGSRWSWGNEIFTFAPDGRVRLQSWESRGLVTSWQVVDRRTILFRIEKGRNVNLYAILVFNEPITSYMCWGFEGIFKEEAGTRKG